MENYVYLSVNGKEGYDNVAAWINMPRTEKRLYDSEAQHMHDGVMPIMSRIVNSVKTIDAVPTADTEWSHTAPIIDPYDDQAPNGTMTVVLAHNGDVCAIAQYTNPNAPDEPHTYLGYNGGAAGMMKFMTELNYTAQPADTVEGATVNNIVLNVDTADIEK